MANEIKDLFGSVTAFTITLASLASSTVGLGRQSTMVSNATTRYGHVKVQCSIKLGTSPTANRAIYVFGLVGDGTTRSDNGGASDAGFTIKNARLLGTLQTGSGPSTGDVLTETFDFIHPGIEFGTAVFQDTGANLDATGGSHTVKYYGLNPEVQ